MIRRREEDEAAATTISSQLPVDVLRETLGKLPCGPSLRRAALASRAAAEAASVYNTPCQPDNLAAARTAITRRYALGMVLNMVRRSLMLAATALAATPTDATVDTRAWAYLAARFQCSATATSPAYSVVVMPGATLRIGATTLAEVGAIEDEPGAGVAHTQRLLTLPSYRAWLDALDGGVSPLGVHVMRDLLALSADCSIYAIDYPTWFAAWVAPLRNVTPASPVPVYAVAWIREVVARDVDDRYTPGSFAKALLVPFYFGIGTNLIVGHAFAPTGVRFRFSLPSVRQVLVGVVGVRVSPSAAGTHLLRTSANRIEQQPVTAFINAASRDAARALWNDYLPYAWSQLAQEVESLNRTFEPEYAPYNGVAMLRALYDGVSPTRVTQWHRMRANRDATLTDYLDQFEGVNEVASSAWLVDALVRAFSRDPRQQRETITASDALALATNLPLYELHDGEVIARDRARLASAPVVALRQRQGEEALFAGGASTRS